MELKNDRFLYRLWTHEKGLSVMFLLLCIMQFIVVPLFGSYSRFMVFVNIFWMLFIMAGIISLAKDKKQALLISIIPFLFLMVQWIDFFQTNLIVVFADLFLSVALMLLLITLVLIKVLEPGPVTQYRIIGSIVVYMLLVNLWCTVYLFIFKHIEGSFQMAVSPFESSSEQANFMYFSYITMTSTGYGEIVPIHPFARSLVQIEVLTGVLYPVILIGRLVSDANFSLKK
ncbi:ion channel [Flavobacterium sp. LAR06]|uniref:ion channel n=1 Tax=Flavobacterium sp. LAR06 TaxID=3064897 RepID=UPI0035C1DE30